MTETLFKIIPTVEECKPVVVKQSIAAAFFQNFLFKA
jgi:hypothetical protein